jgi:hypothetical protein
MAIVYDGPVLPDDLTDFVREVPVPANFILDQLLPNVYIDTNQVDVGQITRTNRTARFRAYDANLHRAQRDSRPGADRAAAAALRHPADG